MQSLSEKIGIKTLLYLWEVSFTIVKIKSNAVANAVCGSSLDPASLPRICEERNWPNVVFVLERLWIINLGVEVWLRKGWPLLVRRISHSWAVIVSLTQRLVVHLISVHRVVVH